MLHRGSCPLAFSPVLFCIFLVHFPPDLLQIPVYKRQYKTLISDGEIVFF